MATPTNYDLEYDDPCDAEFNNCDDEICGNKVEVKVRPAYFCNDVEMARSLTVRGNTSTGGQTSTSTLLVNAAYITVGGDVYKKTVINTQSGSYTVLAVI